MAAAGHVARTAVQEMENKKVTFQHLFTSGGKQNGGCLTRGQNC
jgi:hypothetical protein